LIHSNVPTANDVLVPETLLKKNKSCAKAAEAAVAKKAELRKASIYFTSDTFLLFFKHKKKKKKEKESMMITWGTTHLD
jgi:hypothetical protein